MTKFIFSIIPVILSLTLSLLLLLLGYNTISVDRGCTGLCSPYLNISEFSGWGFLLIGALLMGLSLYFIKKAMS